MKCNHLAKHTHRATTTRISPASLPSRQRQEQNANALYTSGFKLTSTLELHHQKAKAEAGVSKDRKHEQKRIDLRVLHPQQGLTKKQIDPTKHNDCIGDKELAVYTRDRK